MSFFLLILLFLIGVIVWPMIKLATTVHSYQKNVRNAFRSMNDEAERQRNRNYAENRRGGWTRPQTKKKKITNDMGEYVEWEEVSVTESTETTTSSNESAKTYTREEQVTDVKWEDI